MQMLDGFNEGWIDLRKVDTRSRGTTTLEQVVGAWCKETDMIAPSVALLLYGLYELCECGGGSARLPVCVISLPRGAGS